MKHVEELCAFYPFFCMKTQQCSVKQDDCREVYRLPAGRAVSARTYIRAVYLLACLREILELF